MEVLIRGLRNTGFTEEGRESQTRRNQQTCSLDVKDEERKGSKKIQTTSMSIPMSNRKIQLGDIKFRDHI